MKVSTQRIFNIGEKWVFEFAGISTVDGAVSSAITLGDLSVRVDNDGFATNFGGAAVWESTTMNRTFRALAVL